MRIHIENINIKRYCFKKWDEGFTYKEAKDWAKTYNLNLFTIQRYYSLWLFLRDERERLEKERAQQRIRILEKRRKNPMFGRPIEIGTAKVEH